MERTQTSRKKMSTRTRIAKIAGFIKEHGVKPSPRERFQGIQDTLLGWAIVAFILIFFEIPRDSTLLPISFFLKFFSGCFALFIYVLFEIFCSGNKTHGLQDLLIKDYSAKENIDVHLNVRQRKVYIYIRGILATSSYFLLTLSENYFGTINNAALFGADALFYAIPATFIFVQTLSRKQWLGLISSLLGVLFLLFFDLNSLTWKTDISVGIAGLFSAVFFAVIFFVTSIVVRHDTPMRIAFYQCVAGTFLSLIFLFLVILWKFFVTSSFILPNIPAQVVKESITVGILYASALVLFLRAFLYTEPLIIAMLGYSLWLFMFVFEFFFHGVLENYKTMIISGMITFGCFFLLYQEYLRGLFSSKKLQPLKPIYRKSLKQDLLSLEENFHTGVLNKYEYLTEKHEFNKVLLEYANLIKGTIIERIELTSGSLIFTIKPLRIQLEADGGARSAPFEILNFGSYEPEDESMAFSLIQDGDTILDVGAHIGWYSINFAKRFPKSLIYTGESSKIGNLSSGRSADRAKLIPYSASEILT